jgi:antitoxin component YwqK of YwqJK toxin-antitoxin module
MKTKTLLLSAILLFLFSVSFGQGTEYIYYFDQNFAICDKSKAVFTGHGIMKDHLLNLSVYSNSYPETALLIANFTDSSLTINQGLFQSFYVNGGKETECSYENNQLNGAWKKWNNQALLIDSIIYDHGKLIDSARFHYSKTGALNVTDKTDFKNDQFQEFVYNDSGRLTSEVFFTGQKGIRKVYSDSGVTTDSLFSGEEKEASFPGGKRAWIRYISGEINSHISGFSTSDYGTCVVRFIIDTDGKVSDVEAITMKGSKLAKVAVKAIVKGPKWIPATQYGRLVKAYRLQPVTLSNPNENDIKFNH